MKASTYRFTLDLQKHNSQMSIAVFRNDTAVKLCISLTDGGNPYLIGDSCTAIFYGEMPNEEPLIHNCMIEDNTRIIYEFNEATAREEGIVNCQIRLYNKDHKIISAPKFIIVVHENLVPQTLDLGDESLSKYNLSAWEDILLSEHERDEAHKAREGRITALEDDMPLVPNRPIYIPRTYETIIDNIKNYTDADYIDDTHDYAFWGSSTFNRKAKVGDLFSCTCTSSDGYVFIIRARVVQATGNWVYFAIEDEDKDQQTDFILYHNPKEIPLVIQCLMNLRDNGDNIFTYAQLQEKFKDQSNVSTWGRNWFNRDAVVGDEFFAMVRTADDYIVGINAYTTAVASNGRPIFKIVDLELIYNPLETTVMVDEVIDLSPIGTTHDKIVVGYTNSIDKESLNKAPAVNERTLVQIKTADNYIYGALIEITDALNASGFYPFEIKECWLLYDNYANEAIKNTLVLYFVPEFNKTYAQIKAEYDANKAETDESKKDYVYKTDKVYSIWHGNFNRNPNLNELFTATGKSNDGCIFGFLARVVFSGGAVRFAFDDLVLFYDARLTNADTDIKELEERVEQLESLSLTHFEDTESSGVNFSDGELKSVPANVGSMALVKSISGYTSKEYVNTTKNILGPQNIYFGYTDDENFHYEINNDGSITVYCDGNCYCEVSVYLYELLPFGRYYVYFEGMEIRDDSSFYDGHLTFDVYGDSTGQKTIKIMVWRDESVTGLSWHSVEVAPEGTVFEPYKTEPRLYDNAVERIESIGANIFGGELFKEYLSVINGAVVDEVNKTITIPQAFDFRDSTLTFKEFTPYTFFFRVNSSEGDINIDLGDDIYGFENNTFSSDGSEIVVFTLGTKENLTPKSLYITSYLESATFYYEDCGIMEGVHTVEDFKAYRTELVDSIEIPEAVRNLDGYGIGLYEYPNSVDWVDDKVTFTKRSKKIVLNGSEDWISEGHAYFALVIGEYGMVVPHTAVCDQYDVKSPATNTGKCISVTNSSTYNVTRIMLRTNEGNGTNITIDKLKAQLAENPITLIVALATPEVTDITDLFTEDNTIKVEPCGRLRFVNEHKQSVPNTIGYVTRRG